MIFDDELELDEYETFEAPHGTLACPFCGRAVCTFTGLVGDATLDPCAHVILILQNSELNWVDRRLAALYDATDADLSPDEFLASEGVAWSVEEKGWITVYFAGGG